VFAEGGVILTYNFIQHQRRSNKMCMQACISTCGSTAAGEADTPCVGKRRAMCRNIYTADKGKGKRYNTYIAPQAATAAAVALYVTG